jgi:hypothetical protein
VGILFLSCISLKTVLLLDQREKLNVDEEIKMSVEVIFALVAVGLLLIGGGVCFTMLMNEVTFTDEHDELFNRYEY